MTIESLNTWEYLDVANVSCLVRDEYTDKVIVTNTDVFSRLRTTTLEPNQDGMKYPRYTYLGKIADLAPVKYV